MLHATNSKLLLAPPLPRLYTYSIMQVIMDPQIVAKTYLKTWFAVDFVSSFPSDYIAYASIGGEDDSSISYARASRVVKFIRITRLLGLLKLLRISKLLRFIQKWENVSETLFLHWYPFWSLDHYWSLHVFFQTFNLAGGFLRIMKLVIFMLLLAHWNGCIQYLVPYLQGIPEDSWIYINDLQVK